MTKVAVKTFEFPYVVSDLSMSENVISYIGGVSI